MHPSDELVKAVEAGDLASVSKAINAGASVDYEDEDGYTPLMDAAWFGRLDIVKFLIEKGADPNHWAQGDNPLRRAADGGNRNVVEFLTAIVSEQVRNSVDEKDLRLGETRRTRKADVDVESFIEAAMMGNTDELPNALAAGVDVNALGSNGQTALHYASFYSRIPEIDLLLDAGADVNKPNDEDGPGTNAGSTPLGLVASSFFAEHREEVIRKLVKAGADVDWRDAEGMTPLMNAVRGQMGYPDSVEALIDVGADLELMDGTGNTALMIALFEKRDEIVDILRRAGVSENGANEVELCRAAYDGDLETIKKLVCRNDVNVNHSYSWSALSQACFKGHTEIVDVLIQAGANLDERDAPGYFCPLLQAAYGGHLEATRLLVEAGADLTVEIEGIGTALDYAHLGKREGNNKNQPWDEVSELLQKVGTPSTNRY